jgi:hypothetical protein
MRFLVLLAAGGLIVAGVLATLLAPAASAARSLRHA